MGLFDILRNFGSKKQTEKRQQAKPSTRKADATNRNYRASDFKTATNFDCCVGIEINRSNNCNDNCELCKAGAGKYPKDFKWTGWHDGCLCFTTYVLKEDDEFWRDLEDGKNRKSKNTVSNIPKAIKNYISNHPECKNEDWYINNKKYFE